MAPTTADEIMLATSYLGLKLAHPFILGASPLTWHIDSVRRVEDGGCAGIVMHSLFEEQIAHLSYPERFPLGPEEYLEQIRRIKAAVSIPVIGSLNGFGADGWLRYGPLIEQAGADALELNVYYLSTSIHDSSADVERQIETLVRGLKALIHIPLAVKLSPFYTTLASLAARLDAAGADGLVLFNRFYQPDIDVEMMEVLPNIRLSTSADLPLRLRWLAVLSNRVQASLAVTGGVHSPLDGVKALLSGAHAVQMVSAILQQGAAHFRIMEQGLRHWMGRKHHASIETVRGRMKSSSFADPAAFERASYLRVLQTWRV